MDHHALVQARQRFARAEAALAHFEAATNYDEAESAWTDFLLATATIYSKLEQGAKANGKSLAWFGRQKKRRKDEQILRYLHFARNSDEHGIERVTERKENNRHLFGEPFKFGERREITFFRGRDPDTGELIPSGVKGFACGPGINLIRATDARFGDFCDPPEIPDTLPKDPLSLGRAALPLLEAILNEADKLV
jgi:hypothetical protein